MSQPAIDSAGAGNSAGTGKGTFGSYTAGFILSLVLTVIPFALVMQGMLPRQATLIAIAGAAIAQIMVHLYCFLHMDASPRARWYVLSMLFALLTLLLIVGGSMWIMHHLNYRLM